MEQERQLSISEVFPFWWYAAWRLFVAMFAVSILVLIVQAVLKPATLVSSLLDWGIIILGLFLQVYFLRQSLNRTYKPYQQPAFRVSARPASATPADQTTTQ